MPQPIRRKKVVAAPQPPSQMSPGSSVIQQLTDVHEAEALAFLASRSVDALYMTGLIQDNGIESPFNRGTFYGYRDREHRLSGIALIGHATLIETRADDALSAFARLAQRQTDAHLIMGDQDKIGRFWKYYTAGQHREPRLICRELLFEQRWPVEALEPVENLRRATL